MSQSSQFEKSAPAAVHLLDRFIHVAGEQSKRASMPSLLELQTICRKAGCQLPDLDAFAAARDRKPALMVCGGDPTSVRQIGLSFGLLIDAAAVPTAPLIWSWECTGHESIALHFGKADREVSRNTLQTLLAGQLSSDEVIRIEQQLIGDASWRMIWIPFPRAFEELMERPAVVEAFLQQQATVAIEEHVPTEFRERLDALGQKLWIVPQSEIDFEDSRRSLCADVATIQIDGESEHDVRALSQWKWLADRLVVQIEERRRQYQTALDRYAAQVRIAEQTIEQYRRNWMNGLHNTLDEYITARTNGPAFSAFWDAQKKGPDNESYFAAMGLPALSSKVGAFVTDRMAEFVNGLGGLAARIELHRIAFAETTTQWNPRPLLARLEPVFTEKKIFPDGGQKRSGLVGSLTGRKSQVVDERKGQVSRAGRTLAQLFEIDFASWSEGFTRAMTDSIALQLTAALANKGLPDPDGMKAAINGLELLSREVQTSGANREPEGLAIEWLDFLSGRRWFSRYSPPRLQTGTA